MRNVYDGNTLVLTNEHRVSLLGIDTPEIKEQQPFAQEAKMYTIDRCRKRDIWISFKPGGEKEDHYRRPLCFVRVPTDCDGYRYLGFNDGIVEAGYARVYPPGREKRLHNWDTLVELQSLALKQNRCLWLDCEDLKVVKTVNESAYHKRSCGRSAKSRNLTEIMASEVSAKGLHPCQSCFG